MIQDQALKILKTGASVFLTGEPGSGKTYVVNKFADYLKKRGIAIGITASTGIAATHIGGMTIHSFSGIGVAETLSDWEVDRIASTERIADRIASLRVLVIDEISMLAAHTLDLVDRVFREVRNNQLPFGGVQTVFVGDFFQLPPVSRAGRASYAFDSGVWQRLNPAVCYLTEQHRQEDEAFYGLLSAIRSNSFEELHYHQITERCVRLAEAPKSAPKLFTHNVDVDIINSAELLKLPGEVSSFKMASKGKKPLVEQLKRGCLSPENLELKPGATVMFTKNSKLGRFVNGTLGTIAGFDEETKLPIVKLKDGKKVLTERMKWTIEESGSVKAFVEQVPLRLAWAITVHKSQGMSLDEAVMDLSGAFEFGQGYVAISRVRKLSGLYLLGYNRKSFMVDPVVLAKDEEFRNASQMEEFRKDYASPYEKYEAGEESGRMRHGSKQQESQAFAEIRKKHANAYKRWTKDEDDDLRQAFLRSLGLEELAKKFGRKLGAIQSRLAKLGLIDN